MFARYFFIILALISCAWIGYVAMDLVNKKEAYSPSTLFGKEDEQLLVINRLSEFEWEDYHFQTTLKNKTIVGELFSNGLEFKSVYISAKRNHFLVESSVNWTLNEITRIFNQANIPFEKTSFKSLKAKGYTVKFVKNYLYFSEQEYSTTTIENWIKYDKKSSASILTLSDKFAVTEIYKTQNNTIEFNVSNDANIKGREINDFELFSMVVPNELESYHFYEKDYLSCIDPVFKNSPMFTWIDKGFVEIDYKGEKVLISDFKTGQEPLNVLYDFTNEQTENDSHDHFTGIALTKTFPKNKKNGFHVYSLNGFVVIAENQSICENVVADNKLEKTLATDEKTSNALFSNLPKRVSERNVNRNQKYTKTIYKTRILETHLASNATVKDEEADKEEETPSITMDTDGFIEDFIAFNGGGNIVSLTKDGRLKSFQNGKAVWSKLVSGRMIGKIQQIMDGKTFVITCNNSIHVLDIQGNYKFGGIINIASKPAAQPAHFYRYKGREFLVYPTRNGEIVTLNSDGKQHSLIGTKMTDISTEIDSWISQNKLFYGVRNSSTFKMFEADKRREHRSFSIPTETQSITTSNELVQYGRENGKLVSINQKGVKTELPVSLSGSLFKIYDNLLIDYLCAIQSNHIVILDNKGVLKTNLKVDFTSVDGVSITTINSRSYVSVIDGLENNVYLYDLNGRKLPQSKLEGSKKCVLSTQGNHLILTSIIENYIVQYEINL